MIIMINGAFGSGKTSAALMLQPLIENSMIFDPEEIGYMLRKLIPENIRHDEEQTDDFQDLELWSVVTVNTAAELKRKYNKHLIVPMTIYKDINFQYIFNGFRAIDANLFHFCLIASEDTIYNRLARRGDVYGGWQYQQAPNCVRALQAEKYQQHIITDHMETADVVNQILKSISYD